MDKTKVRGGKRGRGRLHGGRRFHEGCSHDTAAQEEPDVGRRGPDEVGGGSKPLGSRKPVRPQLGRQRDASLRRHLVSGSVINTSWAAAADPDPPLGTGGQELGGLAHAGFALSFLGRRALWLLLMVTGGGGGRRAGAGTGILIRHTEPAGTQMDPHRIGALGEDNWGPFMKVWGSCWEVAGSTPR